MQESTDLVLVQVRAIRSLLEAGGSRTSKTVEDVIMRHNDDVAVQIWSSLDPVEQARLLSAQNGTISALAFLATPEQIVRAVCVHIDRLCLPNLDLRNTMQPWP